MREDLRRLIEQAIDELPAPCRSVFMLRAVEGLSVDETAASLGISEANTKIRMLRARARLRESLGQRLGPLLENVFAFDGQRCDRIVSHVCAALGLPHRRRWRPMHRLHPHPKEPLMINQVNPSRRSKH